MTHHINTAFARCLVDEWSRAGLSDAVVAPGSRSTPLALALADDDRFTVHVHIDERSAAFFALGLAKVTRRPSVLLCTSGTAAANFHPAVLEASYARVPMIVCTADRPPELRAVGEGQTVDQVRLYGTAVRWYFEAETPSPERDGPEIWATWRSLAARARAEALGPPAGPVHLNLPFRDPLVPTAPERPPFDLGARPDGAPWFTVGRSHHVAGDDVVDELVRRMEGARGVLVAGWGASVRADILERLAQAVGWPVLADPLSGARTGVAAISTYDALSRTPDVQERLSPEMVVRVGAPLTSKHAMSWMGSTPTVMIDPDRSWSDPRRAADTVLHVAPGPLLDAVAARVARGDESWLAQWMEAEKTARHVIDARLDSWSEPFEGRVARDLMACLPDGARLVVASSMPVRDLEMFAAPREGVQVIGNRGVNGIDGFVSTVLGVAASGTGFDDTAHGTVALVGDVCFLHDANGLLGVTRRGLDVVFVVVDNNGGGIFSFLPQAGLPAHFEELFGTPHDVDITALGALHGVPTFDVGRADELAPAVQESMAAGGVRIVRVRTRRDDNVERHGLVLAAVREAFSR